MSIKTRRKNEVEGCHLIKVARHKTAAHGPAKLFVNKDIGTLMDIYLQYIRTAILKARSRFFNTNR